MKFKNFVKKVLIIQVVFSLIGYDLFAQDLTSGLTLSKELGATRGSSGSEYVSGDYPGAVLMKINLWGAVGKSGIHFVPTQTDLITLLSYAGGPTELAQLHDAFIKRWTDGKEKLILVNIEDLIKNTGKESPILEANDVVVIPVKKPIISSDTSTLISLVSSVLSIVAVSYLLIQHP